jgi:hypothetical protein
MPETSAEYFTTEDVVERYRTTVLTVRYWRKVKYGPRGVKVGRRVLYPRAEVERFDRQLAAEAGVTAP